MAPKKILMFVPFYSPHIGGVEIYAEELTTLLREAGHEVRIVAPRIFPPGASPSDSSILTYPAWEPIHNFPVPNIFSSEYTKIRALLDHEPVDIVIGHTRFFLSSLLGFWYAKKRGVPYLHIEHGATFVQFGNPLVRFFAYLYDQTCGRYLLTKSNHVIAISKAVRGFLLRFIPDEKISVIYRSLELSSSPPPHTFWSSLSPKHLKILFVGRVVRSKGVYELLDAAASLDFDWELVYVGDPTEESLLTEKAEAKGIADRVHFTDLVSPEEIPSFLAGADVLVNPSYTEGLPTTVLEAALLGVPVIATDVGGTREISSAITLVPLKNASALSRELQSFNVEGEKLKSKKEVSIVSQKFSKEAAIQQFERVFISLTS
jgi:colanic acid/amylovoran biosynthesis glycosyltransferase